MFWRPPRVVWALVRRGPRLAAGALLSLPALWSLVTLGRVFASRVAYPMDLESMEGGCLYEAYRVLHGMYLYGPPSRGFVPYGYPPLHPMLLALVGLVRLDYATARGFSIACFAVTAGLLAREVYRNARSARLLLAVFGLGSIAAAFPVVGQWYDLVRNDELAIVVPVAAAAVANAERYGRGRILAVAALLAASMYARQTNAFFVLVVIGFVFLRSRGHGLWLALATFGLSAAALGLAEWAWHGWFLRTVLGIMAKHRVFEPRLLEGWKISLEFAPVLPVLPFLALGLWRNRWLSRTGGLWLAMLVATVPASILPYAKAGGYRNDLIPLLMLAGPTGLVLLGDALRPAALKPRRLLEWTVLPCVALWLWVWTFDPMPYMPTPRRRANAEQFDRDLARLQGGVVSPYHPFVAALYGHTPEQLLSCGHRDAVDAGWSIDLDGWYSRVRPRWVIEDGNSEEVTSDYVFARYLPDPPVMTLESTWGPTQLLERRTELVTGPRAEERVLFDFESGSYAGWTVTGRAFEHGPRPAENPRQATIVGLQGTFAANSYHPQLLDAATGTITSPPFVLERDHMSLRVGGGDHHETRVDLLVDDAGVVRSETGGESDALSEVVWDTRELRGRQARIRVVDEDTRGPWGHIVVDRIAEW